MEEFNDLTDWTTEYIERFIDYLPTLLGAILFLIIGWWVIKLILGSLKRLFAKKEYDAALQISS